MNNYKVYFSNNRKCIKIVSNNNYTISRLKHKNDELIISVRLGNEVVNLELKNSISKLDNNTIRVTINNGQITTSKSIKQSDNYNMHMVQI